jgi:catechol 2,3-dioxygenase-like lactoylglutathione lyase family enzyme
MRLEVVVVPVADVDRAKDFYKGLGWREDADYAARADFRVVQMIPPGSACSVIFGDGLTSAAPGSAQGLHLVASDIDAARAELHNGGAEVSEVFHAISTTTFVLGETVRATAVSKETATTRLLKQIGGGMVKSCGWRGLS